MYVGLKNLCKHLVFIAMVYTYVNNAIVLWNSVLLLRLEAEEEGALWKARRRLGVVANNEIDLIKASRRRVCKIQSCL